MAGFADDLMVKFADDANVTALLLPTADVQRTRIRRLLGAVYSFPFLTVRSIEDVAILGKEFQVPLAAPVELRGALERPANPSEQTYVVLSSRQLASPQWVGMELDLRVTANVEITSDVLEQILSEDLSEVSTLAEFQARFDFIDAPAFMSEAGVATIDELKAIAPQKFRMLYAQPAAFDPQDPRFQRQFRLDVCVLFEPSIDLQGALRAARAGQQMANGARPHLIERDGAEVRSAAAWMIVFPRSALSPQPPSESEIEALFASADIVVAFETPA